MFSGSVLCFLGDCQPQNIYVQCIYNIHICTPLYHLKYRHFKRSQRPLGSQPSARSTWVGSRGSFPLPCSVAQRPQDPQWAFSLPPKKGKEWQVQRVSLKQKQARMITPRDSKCLFTEILPPIDMAKIYLSWCMISFINSEQYRTTQDSLAERLKVLVFTRKRVISWWKSGRQVVYNVDSSRLGFKYVV